MSIRMRENIAFLIGGVLGLSLCFIGGGGFNTQIYRVVFGASMVALVVALVLEISIAPIRSWRSISKNVTAIFLVLFHPFTNQLWLNFRALTVLWIVSAGYLCIDLRSPKRYPVSIALPVIATPFAFFDSTLMVSFWLLMISGIVHVFINELTINRFGSFFLALASCSAAISLIPAFSQARLGMVFAMVYLCWAFLGPGFHEMLRTRKENEEAFAHERSISRIEEKALKGEIRPHFLLNALNNVQVAYHESTEDGRKLLDSLIRLETLAIESVREETIPIQQEVSILRGVIDLFEYERKRKVSFEVQVADPNLQIPPLLLEPLVENSLQHSGVLHQDDGKISVLEWIDHGFATIVVHDNGTERPLPSPSRGIGLSNVQRRVELLDEGKMNIIPEEEGMFVEISFRVSGGVVKKIGAA